MRGFFLPVDKPEGPTSHDVVAVARRALGERRIGHTGTLDPFASGLLVLCVGSATRLSEYVSGLDKEYVATARLGVMTDTLDRDGRVVEERGGWEALTAGRIASALAALGGEIEQVPPQFSAKKVGGVRMHERARRGEALALEPCRVTIHEAELLGVDLPLFEFRLRCSSGTYVRAVARDVGESLGCGAHLTALRRTAVGSVRVESAAHLEALDDAEAVARAALPALALLDHLGRVEVDGEAAARLSHGQRVPLHAEAGEGLVAVESAGGLVAVADLSAGVLRPRKVFAP